ncbi:hypothetical protein BU24DRAFT_461182 [Aaosphaeria arxii CBS 175.79]|uniref:Uncharacterized protein n=1 Tax=Aaosphaeria arxii CBS 175.79 TaxID=1450172 RepID=A0A6A5XZI8_9PLEO|nr:uncharacterized protein BU24DRAFT_461182 [Aaosphaeria arxii CBS 175.79]KAF2018227.1 hypothetical protein BU24DRAFT_461182 [Aaosphaeria arxii CBS 175.79]
MSWPRYIAKATSDRDREEILNDRFSIPGEFRPDHRDVAVLRLTSEHSDPQNQSKLELMTLDSSQASEFHALLKLEDVSQFVFFFQPNSFQRLDITKDEFQKYDDAMHPFEPLSRLLNSFGHTNFDNEFQHPKLASEGHKAAVTDFTDYFRNCGFYPDLKGRQTLLRYEEQMTEAQVVLSGLLNTVQEITRLFIESNSDPCKALLEDFHQAEAEIKLQLDRSVLLRQNLSSVIALFDQFMAYEMAWNMRDATNEAREESKSMRFLTVKVPACLDVTTGCNLPQERSMLDASAMKALTVISLIYLPTTIVANFFSTSFVQTSENGHMQVTSNAWILAAISAPLTAATIALWAAWVKFTQNTEREGDQNEDNSLYVSHETGHA